MGNTSRTPQLPELFSRIQWETEETLVCTLRKILFDALQEAFGSEVKDVSLSDIHLEHPQERARGDFATNIAFMLAGKLKRKPLKIAQEIALKLNDYIIKYHSISITGSGGTVKIYGSRHTDDHFDEKSEREKWQKTKGADSGKISTFWEEKNRKLVVSDILENATGAAPGFLNLTLKKEYVSTLVQRLLDTPIEAKKSAKNITATGDPLLSKKVMVEFAHPNTHKEFHIGHLRNISIGESIIRTLEAVGATLFRANYEGDVGLHVAKAIWGVKRLMEQGTENREQRTGNREQGTENREQRTGNKEQGTRNAGNNRPVTLEDLRKLIPADKAKFLGAAYALGSRMYEEDETAKREIIELNKAIYVDGQKVELWQETRGWSLDYFDTVYKRLGSRFDRLFFESEVEKPGRQLVIDAVKKGIFIKDSDGSIYFPGEKVGLNNCVFVTKENYATYEGKDVALEDLEYRTFPFDVDIHVVASEQQNFFQIAFAAVEQLFPVQKGRQFHLSYGMVNLKGAKLSSRTGEVITADWLIDEAKKKILKIMQGTRNREQRTGNSNVSDSVTSATRHSSESWNPNLKNVWIPGQARDDKGQLDIEDTAEKVAVAAVKYSMLKVNPRMEIAFDIEESVSLEGDSGPYLLYTYARCKSVMRKAGDRVGSQLPRSPKSLRSLNTEEQTLLRLLYRFPEVVVEAAKNLSPNLICSYLFDLAQQYNLFYNKHSILGTAQNKIPNPIRQSADQIKSQIPNPKNESTTDNLLLTTEFRLFLTKATATVLHQGLYLLGIETVERM